MLYVVTWQFVGDESLIGNCRYFVEKKQALETYNQFKNNKVVFKNVVILEVMQGISA